MRPMAWLWRAGVGARNAFFDRGWAPVERLRTPVISVGNLSVGGSGKTPLCILLCELLGQRGLRVAVLSRGYGRSSKGVRVVDPTGSPREFGDEPLLIARKAGVPVVVGEERVKAGRLAEERFAPDVFLLDDGFQHRELARDFDLVLVTPDDARDRLLPSGRLREPVASLARADAVVLANGAAPEAFPLAGKTVWRVRRGILPRDVPSKPVVFCGIARPESFFLQVRKAGIEPYAEVAGRDHFAYQEHDVRMLLEVRDREGANGFVTTEKDAVNLGPLLDKLQPLAVVPVKMTLENAEAALDHMLAVISQRRGVPLGTSRAATGAPPGRGMRESEQVPGTIQARQDGGTGEES